MTEHLFLLHPQLQRLKDDLDRCAADGARAATDQAHSPCWLAILGPPGVGKPRLLRFWLEEASREALAGEEGHVPYLSLSLPASLAWNSSPRMLLAALNHDGMDVIMVDLEILVHEDRPLPKRPSLLVTRDRYTGFVIAFSLSEQDDEMGRLDSAPKGQ